MAQYKDEERGSWYCKFYYQDWSAQAETKRGFLTKREAAAWEREFLERKSDSPSMSLFSLLDLYLEDMEGRLRESTIYGKRLICRKWILPYFCNLTIEQVTPQKIRQWQTTLANTENAKGQLISLSYMKINQ